MRLRRAILLAPGLRHDVDRRPVLELGRVGCRRRELDGQIVDLLRNAGARCVDAKLRRVGACALVAEHDVVRRERRAVVEFDAGAKLDAPRRVVDALPRFCKIRSNAELLVAIGQKFVDEAVDVVRETFILRMRVGRLHVAAIGPA